MRRAAETDSLYQVRIAADRVGSSPWMMGSLRLRLTRCLCDWSCGDQARMERVLPALLTGVRLTSGYSADADLEPVFHWVWPERSSRLRTGADGKREYAKPPPVTPKDLRGIAHHVVQACYDNLGIWEPPIGNTSLAFRSVGLPETRAGLKDLLDRTI
jgi:hypothetical protein